MWRLDRVSLKGFCTFMSFLDNQYGDMFLVLGSFVSFQSYCRPGVRSNVYSTIPPVEKAPSFVSFSVIIPFLAL